jgi:hypothetical protein
VAVAPFDLFCKYFCLSNLVILPKLRIHTFTPLPTTLSCHFEVSTRTLRFHNVLLSLPVYQAHAPSYLSDSKDYKHALAYVQEPSWSTYGSTPELAALLKVCSHVRTFVVPSRMDHGETVTLACAKSINLSIGKVTGRLSTYKLFDVGADRATVWIYLIIALHRN